MMGKCGMHLVQGFIENFPVIHAARHPPQRAREILLDNPMGQDDEMTPIMLVRRRA